MTSYSVGDIVVGITGINLSNNKLTTLALCTDDLDGANKNYVDSLIPDGQNLGNGENFFIEKTGTNLRFASIVGNNLTVTSDNSNIAMNNDMFFGAYPLNGLDVSSITNILGSDKYYGGVLALNGKIYCMPGSSTNIAIIDTKTNSVDTTTITGFVNNGAEIKWQGGALGTDGNIYSFPRIESRLLIVNPTDNSVSLIPIGIGWSGSVLGPNGKIYGIPWDHSAVASIDINTGTIDTTSMLVYTGARKWEGGKLANNGKIYCFPFNTTRMLIFNTLNGVRDTTTIIGFPAATNKWVGGSIADNGKIYACPFSHSLVLVINPVNDTVATLPVGAIPGLKWVGSTFAQNRRIYHAPWDTTRILVINTETDTLDSTSLSISAGTNKYRGGVLAPNGKVYIIPSASTTGLIIPAGIPIAQLDSCLNAHNNF